MESTKSQREKWSMVAQNWTEVSWEEIASTLRDDYAEYMRQYRTKGGVRDLKYRFLQGSYLMTVKIKHDPVERERFKADPYWFGFHQPPNDHNLMLSVLSYNMQSKHDEPIQTLNYKYAKVLESFYDVNVVPDNVAQRLKDGGGIYFIYAQLCKSEKLRREQFVAKDESDVVDTTDDQHPNADEDAEQLVSEDNGMSGNAIVLSGNIPTDGQVVPQGQAMARAANDQGHRVEDGSKPLLPPKEGPLNRVDLTTDLIVTFFEAELDQIRASGGGEITFSILPCDERGFWRALGSIKRLHPRNDRQSSGDTEEPPAAA